MANTYERLCAVLLKDYKLKPDALAPEARLESLGIDSLGTVELLWTVEELFAIKLPTEPVTLPTLADVVHYIDTLVAAQAHPRSPAALQVT